MHTFEVSGVEQGIKFNHFGFDPYIVWHITLSAARCLK